MRALLIWREVVIWRPARLRLQGGKKQAVTFVLNGLMCNREVETEPESGFSTVSGHWPPEHFALCESKHRDFGETQLHRREKQELEACALGSGAGATTGGWAGGACPWIPEWDGSAPAAAATRHAQGASAPPKGQSQAWAGTAAWAAHIYRDVFPA